MEKTANKPPAKKVDLLRQLADELRLQTWLAAAELRHPSLKEGPVRQEVDLLARLRDELRLQLHLATKEARTAFEGAEEDWREIQSLVERGVDATEGAVRRVLRRIRKAYDENEERPAPTLPRLLGTDHARLEDLFTEVVDAARAGVDSRTLREIWTRFRTDLLRHLEVEETVLFPLFEKPRQVDVASLRRVHDEIRRQLDVLDLDVDLHLARAPAIEELVHCLKEHAREEDQGLYRAAEEILSPSDRRALRKRLAAS
jgi:hemerythrin-like domain-containing protein